MSIVIGTMGQIAGLERRRASNGNEYLKLNVRADGKDGPLWINAMVFASDELDLDDVATRLGEGAHVYLEGRATIGAYTSNRGEARPSVMVIVDTVRPVLGELRAPAGARRAPRGKSPQASGRSAPSQQRQPARAAANGRARGHTDDAPPSSPWDGPGAFDGDAPF